MNEIKLDAADNLAPIRRQMVDLIKANSRVVEFGCGNGELLFKRIRPTKYMFSGNNIAHSFA